MRATAPSTWVCSVKGNTTSSWIPCWPGRPFTVPLLVEDDDRARVTLTAGGLVTTLGEFGPGVYSLAVPAASALLRVEGVASRVFDTTFDDTFLPASPSSTTLSIRARECPSAGVYLRWLDTRGGWRYYLFAGILAETRVTDSAPSLEGVDSPEVSHPAGKKVVLARVLGAAGLDADEFNLVAGVARSVIVQALGVTGEWTRVAVEPVTFSRGSETLSNLTFSVIFPEGGGQSL